MDDSLSFLDQYFSKIHFFIEKENVKWLWNVGPERMLNNTGDILVGHMFDML